MELHRRAGDCVALVDEHHRDEPPPLGVRGVPGDLKGVYLVVVEISPFRGAGVSAGADQSFDVPPPDVSGFTHLRTLVARRRTNWQLRRSGKARL